MERLIPILTNLASQDIGQVLRHKRRNALLYGLTALLGLTAYAAAVIGVALYLARRFGPEFAAVLIALAAIALALIILAVVAVLNRRDARRQAERRRDDAITAAAAIAVLPILNRSKLLVAGALVGALAYLAMRRPDDPDD